MRIVSRSARSATRCCAALLLAACGGPPAAAASSSSSPSSPSSSSSAAARAAGGEPASSRTPESASAPATTASEPTPAATAASSEPTPAAATPAGAAADDPEAGRAPGACSGLYDPDHGVPAPPRNALASYHLIRGFGDDVSFAVLPNQRMTYVVADHRDGEPRCFRGPVTPEALATLRAALVRAGACRLPSDARQPIPDRGPLAFAFRLPGLACQRRISGRAAMSEADENRLDAVYAAFDAVGAPVCGAHCRRGSN